MEEKVMLSVIIISYNQEKYIRDAIESVLNQKVNFKYELLLADDCSPDNTRQILEEYQKKYPEIIRILPREKNLGAAKNILDAFSQTKGKYITCLEGDDYWCDENKIQLQVDFLEQHDDFYAVTHIQEGRNLEGKIMGYFPRKYNEDFTINNIEDYLKNEKYFSTSCTLYRNFFLNDELFEKYKIVNSFDPLIGDAQLNFFLLNLGKIRVISKAMMVYRMRNNDGNSNFNSSTPINKIEYRYMNIYIQLEQFLKISLYKKIMKNYTLGVAYDIVKFNWKDIKRFNQLCPKKYKVKIILAFPITCINILINRFVKSK